MSHPGAFPDEEPHEDPPADEGDDDNSLIDPDDPALAVVQANIKRSLTKQLEEAVLALKENTTELDRIKKDREDTGVQLYGVQQHLAKLQEQCQKRSDDLKAVENLRDEREKAKAALQIELENKKKEVGELRTKYFKYQADLDKLSETLLRVEQFNEHMQSEIAIERRSAYKAEDQIKDLEKKKEIQDLLIDTLNEQIKQATEKLALYDSQLDAQRRETRLAQETLTEALREMEAIKFETKQLMQQWKTSLIGMQRRDEALKATEEALEKQKESLLALDNEIQGYKQNIKKEQDKNEQLTHQLAKTEGEVSWLDQQIEGLMQKKAKGMEKLNMLNRSQAETEKEAKDIDRECTALENQIKTLENKTQNINRDIRKLEGILMEKLSEQTTFKKGTESTLQMIERKKKSIREMELQVTNMENELARIRLDTLQTQAHKETLEETVAALEKEKAANLSLHDRMKVDIRRRHDEIERKQKHLDKLNRQYDDFISQHGETSGEGVGPLEATINNLSKAITHKSNENDQLQREWIKAQTELVNLKNQSSELEASIRELRADTTILEQKKLRLEAQTQAEKEDKHDLERKTTEYHQRKKKLDLQLAKNREQSTDTANANANLEEELKRKAREKTEERDKLEETIVDRRAEKQRIMTLLLEAEQQIMGWEKKIQIAKETELAVDPNVGKEEIQRMKQEISMMEQRLAGLKREHSRKIEALNQAVDHRDTLRDKGKAIQANSKNGVTKAQLQRENARLAGDLKKKKSEAATADKQIKASMQNTDQIAQHVDSSQQQNEELRMQLSAMQQDVHVQTLVRDRLFKEKSRRQLTHQRLREAEKGQYKMALRTETREHEVRRVKQRWADLVSLKEDLVSAYPQLRADVQSILGPDV